MSSLTPVIETMEHRWMRAWVNRDAKALKSLTAKDFILLTGSKPPAILDRPSFLEAAAKRWDCSSYRFGDIIVRRVGAVAVFAAPIEFKATMDGTDWSGTVWVMDLWRRSMTRQRWKLVQRTLSNVDENAKVAAAIKSLQLWK